MSRATRQIPTRPLGRAAVVTRPTTALAPLSTLILSVLLGLLAGAAWMQLT